MMKDAGAHGSKGIGGLEEKEEACPAKQGKHHDAISSSWSIKRHDGKKDVGCVGARSSRLQYKNNGKLKNDDSMRPWSIVLSKSSNRPPLGMHDGDVRGKGGQ